MQFSNYGSGESVNLFVNSSSDISLVNSATYTGITSSSLDIFVYSTSQNYGSKEIKFQFNLTEPRRTPPIGELSPDFKSDYCNDATSRKILQSFNETIGVLCLSRNQDSLLDYHNWEYPLDTSLEF